MKYLTLYVFTFVSDLETNFYVIFGPTKENVNNNKRLSQKN